MSPTYSFSCCLDKRLLANVESDQNVIIAPTFRVRSWQSNLNLIIINNCADEVDTKAFELIQNDCSTQEFRLQAVLDVVVIGVANYQEKW